MRAWTHWATSEDWWPLRVPSHDAGTGIDGRPLGRAVRGTAFVFDPFDAYQKSLTTNPNMVVAGGIGMGKSTLVKMLIDRSLERGRRVVIVDPKGEYGPLAALYATTPVVLGRDGWCNPFGPTNHEHRTLVRTMVSSAQATPLTPEQHYVLDEAWRALEGPTPPRVLRALYDVVRGALAVSAPSPERDIALVLRRFITGDLAGLFDGDGPSLDFGEQLVVLDLSQQWASASLAMAALSAISAAQQVAPGPAEQGFVIIDEAWALLADPYALRWLQGSWKLARARGVSHVLVLHRWTDVGAVGDEGSANRARAQGLLRECETVWLFRQLHEELEEMGEALGLRVEERRALAHLRKGQVLVRYGTARSVVNLEPDERDQVFIDTDAAMRGKGGS